MKRTLAVYAVLLVVALIAAYLSWTAKQEPGETQTIVVMHAELEEIERVLYDAEDLDLELRRQEDDAGAFVWVRSVKLVEAKPEKPAKPPTGTATGTGTGTDEAPETEAETPEGKTDAVPDDLTEAAEMLAEAGATEDAAEPEKVEEIKEFKAGESFSAVESVKAARRANRAKSCSKRWRLCVRSVFWRMCPRRSSRSSVLSSRRRC